MTEPTTTTATRVAHYGNKAIKEIEAQGWTVDTTFAEADFNSAVFSYGKGVSKVKVTIRWERIDGKWKLPLLSFTNGKAPVRGVPAKAEFVLRRNPAAEAIQELAAEVKKVAEEETKKDEPTAE